MAALHHLDLIKLVIQSFSGRATLEQIQQVLVPDVIADDWRKWWEVAKKEMKKDGHFQIPAKKSDAIIYQVQETALSERLLSEFRSAKGLKAKTTSCNEALKSFSDLTDRATVANEMIAALNGEIATYLRTQPSVALEGIFVRDDLCAAAGLTPSADEIKTTAVWSQDIKFAQIFEQISIGKHKRALQSFRDSAPTLWHEALLGSLNSLSAKATGECATMLISEGKMPQLKDALAMLISRHSASSELLLWLAKERSDSFADILGPEVFRAMLTAIERDQFNEKKSNRLRDYIMDDQQLLVDLIGSADLEVIKDLTRALQLSPCFDDMDKRSLLARIVKSYPAVQSLISGEQSKQDNGLVVSWESLERRKLEYNELVQKTIPANSKEIAIARSYGDLRENHEYKAAKEMQKILMRRKAELEAQLIRARGTDFANAKSDIVSIGTHVDVSNLISNQRERYTILGAWDSAPEKNIISYLTPVAQALLNKKPGESVEFELEGQKRALKVESIELFFKA
jgi:transcription elongation GreA/GreB family factor